MYQFNEQIARIKIKLKAAEQKDKELTAFGAQTHQYILHQPLSVTALSDFETRYKIVLPECYKAFLLLVGNGGVSYADSAAGPFYGIYPLGTGVDDLTNAPEKYLGAPVKIYPDITIDAWQHLIKETEEDDISDEAYDAALGNIYAGILPIGSQGCTYVHGLVLNGEHAGRVINLDTDRQRPQFCFEDNFLDWYERWLDEILSEDLLTDAAPWFGYTMGGSVELLLNKYHTATDPLVKHQCIRGILSKRSIAPVMIALLEKAYQDADPAYQQEWLGVLTKFSYQSAKPHLLVYSAINPLPVLQFIWWYAKDKSGEWQALITESLRGVTDEETFRFCSYLLLESHIDYVPLIIPLTTHKNPQIRVSAFYLLGKIANKAAYLDVFIRGLHDPANEVIHATLQALSGVKDKRLIPAYQQLSARFPTEQDYILSNLSLRLEDMGISISELKQ